MACDLSRCTLFLLSLLLLKIFYDARTDNPLPHRSLLPIFICVFLWSVIFVFFHSSTWQELLHRFLYRLFLLERQWFLFARFRINHIIFSLSHFSLYFFSERRFLSPHARIYTPLHIRPPMNRYCLFIFLF